MLPIIKAQTDGSITIGKEAIAPEITCVCLARSFYAIGDDYKIRYGVELAKMIAEKIAEKGKLSSGGKMFLTYVPEADKFGILLISTKYNLLGNNPEPYERAAFRATVATVKHKQYKWAQLRFTLVPLDLGVNVPTEVIEAWNQMAIERE